jgi:hypothetical protein
MLSSHLYPDVCVHIIRADYAHTWIRCINGSTNVWVVTWSSCHVLMLWYIYVCICMYVYVRMYMFGCICMYECICMYAYMYVCICMYIYVDVCIFMCVCVCVCVCVCICIYILTHPAMFPCYGRPTANPRIIDVSYQFSTIFSNNLLLEHR